MSRNLGTIFFLLVPEKYSNVDKNTILMTFGITCISNELLFLWILSMCKHWRITHILWQVCEWFAGVYTLIKSTKIKFIPITTITTEQLLLTILTFHMVDTLIHVSCFHISAVWIQYCSQDQGITSYHRWKCPAQPLHSYWEIQEETYPNIQWISSPGYQQTTNSTHRKSGP